MNLILEEEKLQNLPVEQELVESGMDQTNWLSRIFLDFKNGVDDRLMFGRYLRGE